MKTGKSGFWPLAGAVRVVGTASARVWPVYAVLSWVRCAPVPAAELLEVMAGFAGSAWVSAAAAAAVGTAAASVAESQAIGVGAVKTGVPVPVSASMTPSASVWTFRPPVVAMEAVSRPTRPGSAAAAAFGDDDDVGESALGVGGDHEVDARQHAGIGRGGPGERRDGESDGQGQGQRAPAGVQDGERRGAAVGQVQRRGGGGRGDRSVGVLDQSGVERDPRAAAVDPDRIDRRRSGQKLLSAFATVCAGRRGHRAGDDGFARLASLSLCLVHGQRGAGGSGLRGCLHGRAAGPGGGVCAAGDAQDERCGCQGTDRTSDGAGSWHGGFLLEFSLDDTSPGRTIVCAHR